MYTSRHHQLQPEQEYYISGKNAKMQKEKKRVGTLSSYKGRYNVLDFLAGKRQSRGNCLNDKPFKKISRCGKGRYGAVFLPLTILGVIQ